MTCQYTLNQARTPPFFILLALCFFAFLMPRQGLAAPIEVKALNVGENDIVHPGQTIQIELAWPGETITEGYLKWDTKELGGLEKYPVQGAGIVDVVVPDTNKVVLSLHVKLRGAEGSSGISYIKFHLANDEVYQRLEYPEGALILNDMSPALVPRIIGVTQSGQEKDLSKSPELQFSSENPDVLFIDPPMMYPQSPGTTTITAHYQGLRVDIPVTLNEGR